MAKKAKRAERPRKKIPFGEATKIAVDRLEFDRINPRYVVDTPSRNASEADIISELIVSADIAELVQSIAANGYIDIEPMIVMPSAGAKFTVLEGNRRLAAIRLLTNPDLARDCKFQAPQVTDKVAKSLQEITVYAVDKRDKARDFIGFKHINGPHRWDAMAKARFAADWFLKEKSKGVTLEDIARRLGDRHDTVKRLVNGIFVLDQAEKAKVYSIDDRAPGRSFAFSHLYTALTRVGFQEFLGLPDNWRKDEPRPNPVPKDNLENLGRVLTWLYGSKSNQIEPVIRSQNPHVRMLDEILQKPIARKTMLARNRLSEAYSLVATPSVQFESALLNSNQYAEEALSKVSGYDGEDESLMEAANSLSETTGIIVDAMKRARGSGRKK